MFSLPLLPPAGQKGGGRERGLFMSGWEGRKAGGRRNNRCSPMQMVIPPPPSPRANPPTCPYAQKSSFPSAPAERGRRRVGSDGSIRAVAAAEGMEEKGDSLKHPFVPHPYRTATAPRSSNPPLPCTFFERMKRQIWSGEREEGKKRVTSPAGKISAFILLRPTTTPFLSIHSKKKNLSTFETRRRSSMLSVHFLCPLTPPPSQDVRECRCRPSRGSLPVAVSVGDAVGSAVGRDAPVLG